MRKWLYGFVIFIGLLQITGYISGSKEIRGAGTALASSPLPIVFTEVKGVETFASEFYIVFNDSKGAAHEQLITPEMYSRLKGPYNRRNIYGAAIAYGPVLKKELWKSVLKYGLCQGILIREMKLPSNGSNYHIRIKTKTEGRSDEWILNPDCE